ncbi:MAG TPA: hypothetical protein VM223_15750 [Planctomycetota bacterium]|nr:hypothetical protein [Planctomycetota bacterium]
MTTTTIPEFNLNAICDCCEQQAQCADLGEELGMICYHCWAAAKDLARIETCGACGEPHVCFHTSNGWRCSHCLTAADIQTNMSEEQTGYCDRCGQWHVLQRQPDDRWLCLLCRVVPTDHVVLDVSDYTSGE